jgi:hypothetical protein
MKESATYQAAVREGVAIGRAEGVAIGRAEGIALGRAEGIAIGRNLAVVEVLRRVLLRLAAKRLGEPPSRTRERIEGLSDLEVLRDLIDRQIEAGTWDELLDGV